MKKESWQTPSIAEGRHAKDITAKLKGRVRSDCGCPQGPPARANSTKNKHLLAIYAIPTRGFTAVVSVFGGTPPAKPFKLNCKICWHASGDAAGVAWAHHTGDTFNRVLAKISLSPEDITWMSCFSGSQIVHLTLTAIHTVSTAWKTKNPAYVSVSRVLRKSFSNLYLLTPGPSQLISGFCAEYDRDRRRPNMRPRTDPS
jgi:hypothetical protein